MKEKDPLEYENCWDFYLRDGFWGCSEEERAECFVHALDANMGKRCWFASRAFHPKTGREFQNCHECPWY
ncbi:hypothetical protein ACFL5E_04145, partial [Candidatus Omnitrophota bacterium]